MEWAWNPEGLKEQTERDKLARNRLQHPARAEDTGHETARHARAQGKTWRKPVSMGKIAVQKGAAAVGRDFPLLVELSIHHRRPHPLALTCGGYRLRGMQNARRILRGLLQEQWRVSHTLAVQEQRDRRLQPEATDTLVLQALVPVQVHELVQDE